MAPHDEENDPAVYQSGSRKRPSDKPNGHTDGVANGMGESPDSLNHKGENGQEDDNDSEEEDDATLLTVQPGFNRLLLVLRDERVMRFVKYVSAAAEGSRWDICGEYEIGMVEQEDTSE